MWNALNGSVAAQAFSAPQAMELPPAREFLTSAGFAGTATLVAAIVVAVVALVSTRASRQRHVIELEQQEHHHNELREDQQHAAALARCWRRLEWVVDTAGIEPASSQGVTLGLGPELAAEILQGLIREADELGDEALGNAATVHLSQLSLVLAHQSGSLLHPATGPTSKTPEPEKPTSGADSAGKPRTEKPVPAATTADGAPQKAATPARTRRANQ
jgi:hypothetical protein